MFQSALIFLNATQLANLITAFTARTKVKTTSSPRMKNKSRLLSSIGVMSADCGRRAGEGPANGRISNYLWIQARPRSPTPVDFSTKSHDFVPNSAANSTCLISKSREANGFFASIFDMRWAFSEYLSKHYHLDLQFRLLPILNHFLDGCGQFCTIMVFKLIVNQPKAIEMHHAGVSRLIAEYRNENA